MVSIDVTQKKYWINRNDLFVKIVFIDADKSKIGVEYSIVSQKVLKVKC